MIKVVLVAMLACTGFAKEPSLFLAASTSPPPVQTSKSDYVKQKELETLNNEIEALVNLRDYYSAKMTRYRNKAARYEFQGDHVEEAKQHASDADKIEGVIRQIDEEIASLEKQRNVLLK